MAFKVAVAQFAPVKADVSKNLDTIAEVALQAQREAAELVVLPETSTTAYFLEGGVLDGALTGERLRQEIEARLCDQLLKPIDIALGFYEIDGGHLYNSAAYIEAGPSGAKLVHVYRKFFLPTYGVFDEERFVTRGRELGVFDTRLGRMAILICEDVWHSILPSLCAVNGAQMLLIPSASPARGFTGNDIGNHDRYQRLCRAISEEHGMFCLNSQLCGFEGGKGFIGGSTITDPFGRFAVEGPLGDEALLVAEVDLDLIAIARAQLPLISDLQSAWNDLVRIVNK